MRRPTAAAPGVAPWVRPGGAEAAPGLGTLLCSVGRVQATEARRASFWQGFPTAAEVSRTKRGARWAEAKSVWLWAAAPEEDGPGLSPRGRGSPPAVGPGLADQGRWGAVQ